MSHHHSGPGFGFPTAALTEDVVDFFLPLLTNGKVTRGMVGPHNDLLATFPYAGVPHEARSVTGSRLMCARDHVSDSRDGPHDSKVRSIP
jgi:hypothetical protein